MFAKRSFLVLVLAGSAIAFLGSSTAYPADPPANGGPSVTITQGSREATATPSRCGLTHTGGGNIDVAQPSPDTLIVTMSGVAVACGNPCKNSHALLTFALTQCFEVVFEKPDVKRAKLTVEGRIIGLLRSHCKGGGSAQEGPGTAVVSCDAVHLATLALPAHSVAGGENLSVNDRCGPITAPIGPGKYTLVETWTVSAAHPCKLFPCKAASAEFAPDPALDPLWISFWEPFHGANKKDFGFQVILKVTPEAEHAASEELKVAPEEAKDPKADKEKR